MSANYLYKELSKWFALTPPFVSIVTLFIDAPFGRFALRDGSKWILDGIKSWIVMEIICPITFLTTLLLRPLVSDTTTTPPLLPSFKDPRTLLSSLFLIHYTNRALISPLRSPPRSTTHIIVPLAGFFYQSINGSLLGSYFSSPQAYRFLNQSASAADKSTAFYRPSFWLGVTLWTAGFVGNVLHDEILMNIRRNALQKKTEASEKPKPKNRETPSPNGSSKPYYAIPRGYLYTYISYPNYFCEWVEWAGFALASAPFPALSSYEGITTAAPPWIFFFSLVFLMGSRAYRGHLWYLSKFPEYPKERKAVIPFVL